MIMLVSRYARRKEKRHIYADIRVDSLVKYFTYDHHILQRKCKYYVLKWNVTQDFKLVYKRKTT